MRNKNSVYADQIGELNVSDIFIDVLNGFETDGEWCFETDDFIGDVEQSLQKLDFHHYDYMFVTKTYWCGVLMAVPFDKLMCQYTEEDILNIIGHQHLKLVNTEYGLVLRFHNPTKSPLYRFFNQYKSDGYGGNITASVHDLLHRVIKRFFEEDFSENLESYGEWVPNEEIHAS